MNDAEVLGDAALGDQAAILPGAALGQSALLADAGAPRKLPVWSLDLLGISTRSEQAQGVGFADPKRSRGLGDVSALRFYCFTPATFVLDVFFHVDVTGSPRPKPFAPPTCQLNWYFQPSDGSAPTADNWQDSAPRYTGEGEPLLTQRGSRISIKTNSGGTLSISAILLDSGVTVFYQDSIQCVITPCRDGGGEPVA